MRRTGRALLWALALVGLFSIGEQVIAQTRAWIYGYAPTQQFIPVAVDGDGRLQVVCQ